MEKDMIAYPCALEVGDVVITKHNRKRTVERIGKYIYFSDGSQYSFKHPDILGVIKKESESEACEAVATDEAGAQDCPMSTKPKRGRPRSSETQE